MSAQKDGGSRAGMTWPTEWTSDRDLQSIDSVPVRLAAAGSLSVLCVNQQRTRRCAQVVGDTRGDETSRGLRSAGAQTAAGTQGRQACPLRCFLACQVPCYRNRWSLRY